MDEDKTKDMERFLKFFVIKSVQVIVQSRINSEKIKTECRLPGNNETNDWFNLQIPDNEEILKSTHCQLLSTPLSSTNFQLSIQIYLKTDEIRLLLEIWRVVIVKEAFVVRDVYEVYNRLGRIVKSLLCVSRVMPAYKLSRSREFEIQYEIGGGDNLDDLQLLGDKWKEVEIGKVPLTAPHQPTTTPTTNYTSIHLYYRTELLLLPLSTTTTHTPLLIKSDHYSLDKSQVKPAFFDEVIKIDNAEVVVPGQLLLSKRGPMETKEIEAPVAIEPEPVLVRTHNNQPVTPLQLPFISSTTATSSSSSETELLNMFEEFRVAPRLFDEEREVGVDFVEFEGELGVYEELVRKLGE